MNAQQAAWTRILLRSLVRIAVILGLLGAVLFACQSKLIYHPSKAVSRTPRDAGLPYEDVWLTTADNVKIHGWIVPAKSPKAMVLLCHGNGGNISHRIAFMEMLNQIDLSVLAFDYRGYGKSEGSPDEVGTYLDAEAAWRYLTEDWGVDADKIVLYGRSLGGAVASHVAVMHAPLALVVDSAFTSLDDIGQETYWFLPVRLLSRYGYRTAENVGKMRIPVLVIHSRADGIVPYHHGERIFAAASAPKRFLTVNGGHNDNFIISRESYRQGIRSFVDWAEQAELRGRKQ